MSVIPDSITKNTPTQSRRAKGDWISHTRFWLVAGGALTLDLWSKHFIFENLESHEVRTAIPNVLEFHQSLNDGAVFGSFGGYVGLFITASIVALVCVLYAFLSSHRKQRVLHIALGLVLAGALGNLHDRVRCIADIVMVQGDDGQVKIIIGKITSEPGDSVTIIGAWPKGNHEQIYNSSDVVTHRRQGVVRDFLKVVPKFPEWVPRWGGKDIWPWIFNVADSALVCGVMLLLISGWFDHYPKKETPEPAT